jgi:hypothetical protein
MPEDDARSSEEDAKSLEAYAEDDARSSEEDAQSIEAYAPG